MPDDILDISTDEKREQVANWALTELDTERKLKNSDSISVHDHQLPLHFEHRFSQKKLDKVFVYGLYTCEDKKCEYHEFRLIEILK